MASPTNSARNKLRLTMSAAEISDTTNQIIKRAKTAFDAIASLPAEKCNFESVLLPMAKLDAWFGLESNNVTFPHYVSPHKDVRDAAVEAKKLLDDFDIEQKMREDLYKAVQAAADKKEKLDAESERYVTFTLRDFKRNGLALPKEKRDQLSALKKKLADLCTEFSKNMNSDTTEILFTQEELDGMPYDFLEGLSKKTDPADGKEKLAVTMKYPDIIPTLRMAKREETRKRLDTTNGQKCAANVPILKEAIKIRSQIATLLGYESHASYILETRMAKTPETVNKFLANLRTRLTPFAESELEHLLDLKKQEQAALGLSSDNKINSWDFNYYNRLLLEKEYQVDDEHIKEYFSLEVVTQGMLQLYQTVLSLKFTEVKNPSVWHEDVRLFDVADASGDFMGQFYLDLHPRDGKFTHAAVFGLQPGCDGAHAENKDGQRQYPVCAMVGNFSKPSATKPSLLKHSEVITYFHELGHVMHQLCAKTNFPRFHGTRVERDFVEAPSQMLENWCWDATILEKLSAHYQDSSARLPDHLATSLVRARNVNSALLTLRQIFFATYDYTLHTAAPDSVDPTQLWHDLRTSITLLPSIPATHPEAAFGHIMGGYDSSYYGYLYSQVFSADMFFSRFEKEGLTNPQTGKEYRDRVLKPGGSEDGGHLVHAFLGREPRDDWFLKSLGLDAADGAAPGVE
ncbi:hypothetical protein DFJ77DRAFT_428180 [Powellomyces hirtus]|nr:hypothetical protein DFJ77DRAFT_428180 [Powellomyces hirtus]